MKKELKTRKSGTAISLRKARLLLAALVLTGAFVVPSAAQAAVRSEPMVVTEKDKVIDDDFYVVNHKYPEAIYVDPVSTGTVQVNSKSIRVENAWDSHNDIGILDTGYGWNGILKLKSGMQISGSFMGNHVQARGLQLNGFEMFTKTDNTGKPYAGTARLGDDISIKIKDDHAIEYNALVSTMVDGENLQAGNIFTTEAYARTGKCADVSGLKIVHYGTVQIGDNAFIKAESQVDQASNHFITDALLIDYDWGNETVNEPAKGRQKLSIGNDATIVAETHNDKNYSLAESEVMGIRLSHTDFTLGNRAQVHTLTTGTINNAAGTYGNINGIWTDNHTQANIGDYLTNEVTAKGRANLVIGLVAQNDANAGEVDEGITDTLSIGKEGKTLVSYEGDSDNVDTRGVEIYGALIRLGEDNTIQSSAKNTHTHGTGTGTYGIKVNASGRMEAEQGLLVKVDADNEAVAYGTRLNDSSTAEIRNYFTSTLLASNTDEIYGLFSENSELDIGDNSLNKVQAKGKARIVIGIKAQSNANTGEVEKGVTDTLSIGNGGKTFVSYEGDSDNIITRGIENNGALIRLGNDNTIQVSARDTHTHGTGTSAYGIKMNDSGRMEAGQGLQVNVNAINESLSFGIRQNNHSTSSIQNHFTSTLLASDTNEADGVFSVNSQLTIGDDSLNEVQVKGEAPYFWITGYDIEGKTADGTPNLKLGNRARAILSQEGNTSSTGDFYGIYINNALAKVGNEASFVINGNIEKPVSGAATQIRGIYSGNGTGIIGDNLTIHVSGHNYAMVSGLAASAGNGVSSLSVGDNAKVTVSATEDETGTTNGLAAVGGNYIAGIKNWGKGSSVIVGKNADIEVTAPSDKDTSAVWTSKNAETTLGDGAVLKLSSNSTNVNAAVMSQSGGNTVFTGGAMVYGSKNAIESTGSGSEVTMTGNGRKVIMGDLLSEDNGTMSLNLNTVDSLLRGKSMVDGGTTNLTLTNGARWDMTGDSTVSTLTHENGGIVNMEYSPSYQKLEVGNYTGRDGLFLMKTDLDSEKDGDKIHMASASIGSQGKIQVDDRSFLTGKEVTGNRHLLLVTDDSKNAAFTGETLDKGGLWDVTPTIQNGSYVRNEMGDTNAKDTEWYLTKLHRSINESTKTLLRSTDNTYALYRNSMDTLRQRMGELRFRNKKEDVSGLWARDTHGAYGGDGVYSKYNRLQLGYDYAANRKSIYGFLFERGIGNPRYENGNGKDHTFAGAFYGTWLGDNGSYTDVVAKVGRDDTTLHSYGQYPDSASFRTREESLSVEYGRTHTLNDKGLFLEPQAQIVFGHLDSKDYTTSGGKTVHMDSYNSAIGRLGLLLGQRKTEGDHPFDYYAKVSVLHEFGGDRDYYLTAPDGETMNTSEDYRDTWVEAGFGGTCRINGSTYLYADGEREFGGKWNRKWQWNVGIHWQF